MARSASGNDRRPRVPPAGWVSGPSSCDFAAIARRRRTLGPHPAPVRRRPRARGSRRPRGVVGIIVGSGRDRGPPPVLRRRSVFTAIIRAASGDRQPESGSRPPTPRARPAAATTRRGRRRHLAGRPRGGRLPGRRHGERRQRPHQPAGLGAIARRDGGPPHAAAALRSTTGGPARPRRSSRGVRTSADRPRSGASGGRAPTTIRAGGTRPDRGCRPGRRPSPSAPGRGRRGRS